MVGRCQLRLLLTQIAKQNLATARQPHAPTLTSETTDQNLQVSWMGPAMDTTGHALSHACFSISFRVNAKNEVQGIMFPRTGSVGTDEENM